jgi:hypothetical protein
MKILIKALLISLLTPVILLTLTGCVSEALASNGIRLSSPGDLHFLAGEIDSHTSDKEGPFSINLESASDGISKLKNGKLDAVLLGREPDQEEVQGLLDRVIAYDAVCIILDENSFMGGSFNQRGGAVQKTTGLQDLTRDDLKHIFSFNSSAGWPWNGEYYIRDPGFDPNSWLFKTEYGWTKTPATVTCNFVFTPGKFDTQTVLYRSLGLDEDVIISKFIRYPINQKLNLEEEVLSYQYSQSIYYAKKYGPQNFAFQLGFASRRVMPIALKHVPVKIVSIDGINPLENPQSVYDGTYVFSRKIHLLIPQKSPPAALKIAEYLLSQEGQQMIADSGYLPVAPNR